MKHFIARIRSNSPLCEGVYQLDFSWNDGAEIPRPGQFCTIRASYGTVPLLRRPFAFADFDPVEKIASIVFKKVGASTEILAGKEKGEALDVIGPLGNSFVEYRTARKSILVAGGTGFGPIFFWKRFLKQQGISAIVVLGSASKAGIPGLGDSDNDGVVLCTEDGSTGFRGTVLDYLKTLPGSRFRDAAIYCCGPSGMLKACNDLALQYGIDCFVSLEQTMACGVGACMGCAVKIKGEPSFARVCTEGPVFNGKAIEWT